MKIKSALFTIGGDPHIASALDCFIARVGWENIKEIVPTISWIIFFYEVKENNDQDTNQKNS